MSTLLYRLGHTCVRYRWIVLAFWIGLLASAAIGAQAAGGELSEEFDLPGTESGAALDLLKERFPAQSGSTARVVAEAPEGQKLIDFADEFSGGLEDILILPGVVAPPDPSSIVTVSEDGRVAFAEIKFEEEAQFVPKEQVEALKETARRLAPPVVKVSFGGDAITAAEETEPPASEAIGLAVAVVVLLIVFGSVIAMGLPMITALIGVGIGILGITITSAVIELNVTAPTMATMIGLAVAIDYALFIVTRHRQFLHTGHTVSEAAARANATSGAAVVFAGMTVVIAMASLFVVGIPFLTVMGLSAAATVAIAVLIAITLIPAFLGFAGENIDKLTIPGLKASTGEEADSESGFSAWFAHLVTERPLAFLTAGLALMAVLAIPALSLELGLPDDGTLPDDSTQRQAYDTLTRAFGPGFNGPLTLVVDLSETQDSESTLAAIAEAAATDPNIQDVASPVINQQGDTAIIAATPTTGPSDAETADLVHRLRDEVLPPAVEGTGADVLVAGSTALNVDISDKLTGALFPFMGLVIGLTFLVLLLAFRSIIVPIKAAIAILLSIAASFGVLVAVFQWGWFGGLVGVQGDLPIVSFLPLFMFAVLFGLSMDYEVFILTRIKEDYTHNGNLARRSVLTGLTASARVITAAAAIMISVFAAFVLGDNVIIKMLGVGLAVAVFLDATVVRMMIVPSVMTLFDKTAWWLPQWLDKLLPNLDVEGEKLLASLETQTPGATSPSASSPNSRQ